MEKILWNSMKCVCVSLRNDIIRNKNGIDKGIVNEGHLSENQIIMVIDVLMNVVSNDEGYKKFYYDIVDISKHFEYFLKTDFENKETFVLNEKIKKLYLFLLELMKNSLLNNENEVAADIADILQGMFEPEYLNDKKSLKNYWKGYIKPFMKKRKHLKNQINEYKIY